MDTCIKFKVGLVVSLIENSIALVIYFSYCNKNCNITSTKVVFQPKRRCKFWILAKFIIYMFIENRY